MINVFSVYADSADLDARRPMELFEWKEMLKIFVEDLARDIMQKGAALIGHIKGIAELAPSTYMYFSKPDDDAVVEIVTVGNGRHNVARLTINIICLGLNQDVLKSIFNANLEKSKQKFFTDEVKNVY